MDPRQLLGAVYPGTQRCRAPVLLLHLGARLGDEVAAERGHAVPLLVALGVRLGGFVATLVGALLFLAALLQFAPGDAIDLMPNAAELRPQLEADWGLDQPVHQRIGTWLTRLLHGDLGISFAYRPGKPVREIIARPALRSIGWLCGALLLSVGWGTALAWRHSGRTSWTQRSVQAVSLVPVFLAAHLIIDGLNRMTHAAVTAGWIARPGWFALPIEPSTVRSLIAITILAVGSGALSTVTDEIDDALSRVRNSGFVDAARARGTATWPHVLRNMVVPLISITTRRLAFFVGGLVILEKVLLLNGVGRILWEAALLRDFPLALGVGLVLAAVVASGRLIGHIVALSVDPRLRQTS